MFNYILIALLTSWQITCALTSSDIVCSKHEVSWKDGMQICLNIGLPMYFGGLTGLNIENINLRPDVTVWTSDYIYSRQHYIGECLCSFRYLTNETYHETNDELFAYCHDFKYFLCRNNQNNFIEVLNNTWYYMNASRCGSFPVDNQLKGILKPGYYWKNNTQECAFHGFATTLTQNLWQTNAVLCGAYSKGAGRHFRRCNTLHRQVCVRYGTTLQSNLFDSSCFLGKNTETTETSKVETLVSSSYQQQSTKPSKTVTASIFVTDTTPSVSHAKQSNLHTSDNVNSSGDYTTKLSPTSAETQMSDNSTLGHAKGSAYDNGAQDTGTDAGTIAGIVVGVCLALTGGVVLLIFIQKRYRCLFDKTTTSKPKANNDTSKISKKSKAPTLFNNLAYDSWDDNHKPSQTKQSKRNNIEISNNEMSSTNQLCTVKDKELPSRGNIIYYNQSTPIYANDLNEAQTTATSTYSFAEETEIDVGEKEMLQDDYYTTISTRKKVHKTENLYNKIEPENQNSDVYDSTLCQGQSFETDDVYNKLSCKTNSGKFGTTLSDNEDYDSVCSTLKDQNTQHCTDNVYN